MSNLDSFVLKVGIVAQFKFGYRRGDGIECEGGCEGWERRRYEGKPDGFSEAGILLCNVGPLKKGFDYSFSISQNSTEGVRFESGFKVSGDKVIEFDKIVSETGIAVVVGVREWVRIEDGIDIEGFFLKSVNQECWADSHVYISPKFDAGKGSQRPGNPACDGFPR